MNRSVMLCVLLFFCSLGEMCAQQDTILLKELKISSVSIQSFTSGVKEEAVEVSSLPYGASLSALAESSTLFIRSYGNNMLASVSIRGTSASRTAVLWNGLAINSMTLGQSDLMLLPIAAIDEASIQYGSGSSLYGSGAIGGSISLSSVPQWKRKPSMVLKQSFGSFSTYNTTGKVRLSNGSIESVTSFYRSISKNDFEFKNITKKGHPIQKQTNANFLQHGLSQDFYYKASKHSLISLNTWYASNDRSIQPQMLVTNSNENIEDKNTRALLKYETNLKGHFVTAKLGWVKDDQLYNKISSIITYQRIVGLEWNKQLTNHVAARVGGTTRRIKADVSSYEHLVIEHRTDAFASLKYTNQKLSTSLNIRKSWVTNTVAPITPSLGIDYLISPLIKVRGQLSMTYRVPTLNDKYWPSLNGTAGNINIKSERGYATELGTNLQKSFEDMKFDLNITAYQLWVDDWIVWTPASAGVWTPENLKKVVSKGIELNSKISASIGAIKYTCTLNYTRNSTRDIKSNERSHKRLPFAPEDLLNMRTRIGYRNISFAMSYVYTDSRYANTDNSYELESFEIINLSGTFKTFHEKLKIRILARNLFNEVYQPSPHYAVPGRNYQLDFQLSI